MRNPGVGIALLALCLCGSSPHASGQTTTTLPGVTVTGTPMYSRHHGGYLISGDFKVDDHMPNVVFPARALVKDDILSVRPLHLNDDEYLVLQECVVADCSVARVVRVWGTNGALTPVAGNDFRIWITHDSRYFIWLEQLPEVMFAHFSRFQEFSPPLTLVPTGRLAASRRDELQDGNSSHPIRVKSYRHHGATFIVTFASGSVVRVQRMHAAH